MRKMLNQRQFKRISKRNILLIQNSKYSGYDIIKSLRLNKFLITGVFLAIFLVLFSVNFVSAALCNREYYDPDVKKCCPSSSNGQICLIKEEICCNSHHFISYPTQDDWDIDTCVGSPDINMCGSVSISDISSCQEPSYFNFANCLLDRSEDVGFEYPGEFLYNGRMFHWFENSDCKVVNLIDGTSCAVDEGTENEEQGYCKNGQCIEINPEVNLKLDEEYIEKTKEERLFRPKEITPFDDIVCEIKLESFLPDLSFEFFEGKLVTTDSKGEETLLSSGTFSYLRTEGNYRIFGWKIQGWPDGITNDEDMEKIIENQNIRCVVEINGKKYSDEIKTSNCVHIYGGDKAEFPVVYLKGESIGNEFSAFDFVQEGIDNQLNGFEKLSPFKEYKEKFSYYTDLAEVWDILITTPLKTNENLQAFLGYAQNIDKVSKSCDFKGGVHTLYSHSVIGSFGLKSHGMTGIIVIEPRDVVDDIYISTPRPLIFMHELGHALCSLDDEYVYPKEIQKFMGIVKTNCRGKGFLGLGSTGFSSWGKDYKGCSREDYYRSSEYSLMKTEFKDKVVFCTDPRFNVISCGYCLNAMDEIPADINGKIKIETGFDYCKAVFDVIKES